MDTIEKVSEDGRSMCSKNPVKSGLNRTDHVLCVSAERAEVQVKNAKC